MAKYILKRIAQNVVVFFIFLTFVFFLLDAQPGDFGNSFLNDPRLTAEQRQQIRQQMGLDKSAVERYVIWMGNFLTGDFGVSFSNYPTPVLDIIKERAPRTLVLFVSVIVVSFYFGFLAGKILAWQRGGGFEYLSTVGGVFLYTVFTPWFGLMMIWIFAFKLEWFPIGKFIDPKIWRAAPEGMTANSVFNQMLIVALIASLVLFAWMLVARRMDAVNRTAFQWSGVVLVLGSIIAYWQFFSGGAGPFAFDILHHLVLPIITGTLISFAGTMLLTRNSMLEILREDYVMTARAKGLPEKVVRDKHVARNALLPVITSFILALAFALDGGIVTETIFSWPGMGLTLLQAAQQEDIPMTIGAMVFVSVTVLLGHLVVDILYAYLDPRIRYSSQ